MFLMTPLGRLRSAIKASARQGPRHRGTFRRPARCRIAVEILEGRCVPSTYNAALDFSATDNPNGVWSYGWSPTLGADFVPDAATRNVAGVDGWLGEQAGDGNPSVSHNGTADAVTEGAVTWQPGQLAFHPGPNGEYSVVRWTAPRAGALSLGAAFSGLDSAGPTSTDVHVLHNGATLFDGEVLDLGAGPSFTATQSVLAGETIDFAVGYGSDGTFSCDTTGLDATVSYTNTLSVGGLSSPITAGEIQTVTVTALDEDGNVLTDYTGTVHFASTDPQANLPADYTFTAGPGGDNGVHVLLATLKSAGLQTLSVSDTAGATASANIEVNRAAVSQLSVAGFPSPHPVGIAGTFGVTATDPFGNHVPSYTGTVHFTSTDPLATVSAAGRYDAAPDFSATDNPNGIWSYGWSPSLGGAFVQDTSHRNVSGIDFWMGEQAGDGNPSVSHNGTTNPITPGSMTWQPGQLGFHPGPNGEDAVVRWTAPRAGALSLGAAFSGLDFVGPTSTDVHVLHNGATLFDGEVLDFGAGPSFDTTVVVAAGDTIDFAVGYGSDGNFSCDTTGLDAFISYNDSPVITDYTFTSADAGSHTFIATFSTAGLQSLTATDTQAPSITGGQQNIEVTPGMAVSGFPATITAGVAGSFTVTAQNADGSTSTGYRGTAHFTSSDAQAVLPPDYTFTAADNGVHTFAATLKTAGSQSITVTDTVDPSVTGTQASITVNPAAASSFTVAGFPSPVTAGVAGSFTVTARDAFGNRATGYTGTVRFTSSDTQAVLPGNYAFTAGDAGVHTFSATLKSAGTRSLTATDTVNGALTGAQGSIQVNPAAARRLVLSAPASVKAGAKFSLTITVVDAYGNVATGYRGTIRFGSSDSSAALPRNYIFTAADLGVHTFTGLVLRKKGNQTITVTDTADGSITGSVSINVLASQQ
jgi:hypothetical protein